MKLAITAEENTLASPVDPRFGRARWFIIYDGNNDSYEAIENIAGVDASQGAGPKAAEAVAAYKVDCVITGHCGPKAFRALSSAGIRVVVSVGGTVAESVARFRSGDLTPIDGPDVQGHWE